MEKSKVLVTLGVIAGILGILVKCYAWWSAWKGTGLTPELWFLDAVVLMLAAIWFKLGAIYHKK
jgi:hypothetical protein